MATFHNPTPLSVVTESARRCMARPVFYDTFFAELSRRLPEAAALFAGADQRTLHNLLRGALTLLLLDAAGSPQAAVKLDRVRHRHGPAELELDPAWFPHWTESLMVALRRGDPFYSVALEGQWRKVVAPGIEKVIP